MSELRLKDGTGTGDVAKVDEFNRLHVRGVAVPSSDQRGLDGFGFNLNTGHIALADGGEHAVAYFKYTGTKTFHLDAVAVGIGALSGAITDPVYVTISRNPTGGTIVDNAVPGSLNINRNFGSPNALDGLWYQGVHGDTLTGGEDGFLSHVNGSSRVFLTTNFVLKPQNSIGIKINLNAASGGNLYIAFVCYEESE
jgi:hypothetical protein